MFIGIDTSRDKKNSYLGFASSYDPFYSKYYTQLVKLEEKSEYCSTLGQLLVNALNRFYEETKSFFPELIVIYRDGVGESQVKGLLKSEFSNMIDYMKGTYPSYEPKIIFATVNKRIHTRLFTQVPGRELSNPLPGTVVHSGILNSKNYEFLLMPQFVKEGTGTPSKITVLYDTSGLSLDTFEEMTNAMCYAYDNWPGAIRTPAPCKYAMGHAKLAARYTQTIPNTQLLSNKYFL